MFVHLSDHNYKPAVSTHIQQQVFHIQALIKLTAHHDI